MDKLSIFNTKNNIAITKYNYNALYYCFLNISNKKTGPKTEACLVFLNLGIPNIFRELGRRSSIEDRSVQIVHKDRRGDDQRTQDLKDEGYSGLIIHSTHTAHATHTTWHASSA